MIGDEVARRERGFWEDDNSMRTRFLVSPNRLIKKKRKEKIEQLDTNTKQKKMNNI